MATISNNEIKIKYSLDTTDLANATQLFDRLSAEDRQLLNDLKRLQTQLNATGQAGQTAGNNIGQGMSNAGKQTQKLKDDLIQVQTPIRQIGTLISGAFAIQAIYAFGKEALRTAVKIEGLKKAIEFTSKSTEAGAANFEFLRKVAEDLGLPLEAAAEGFRSFSAAAGRSGYTTAEQREMFLSLSEAMAALQLDAQSAGLIFFGFGQLMSKTKVSAQEVYHQIGERLPIAMEAAQIAVGRMQGKMKVAGGEFDEMLRKGELMSSEFAPEFTKALGELGASGAYVESLGKDVNRLSNAWDEFLTVVGNSTPIRVAVQVLTDLFVQVEDILDYIQYYGGLNFLETGFGDIQEYRIFQQELLDVYNGILENTEFTFQDLRNIQKEYNKASKEETAESLKTRKELEEKFNQERVNVVKTYESQIRAAQFKLQKAQESGDQNHIVRAQNRIKALKKVMTEIPSLTLFEPNEEDLEKARKKREKALEDAYKKELARIEAFQKAKEDLIKADMQDGRNRDIAIAKNNENFNKQLYSVDLKYAKLGLELAKNNGVERNAEIKLNRAQQKQIVEDANEEALKAEKDYLEKAMEVLQDQQRKRRQAIQTDEDNEIETSIDFFEDKIKTLEKKYTEESSKEAISKDVLKKLEVDYYAARKKLVEENEKAIADIVAKYRQKEKEDTILSNAEVTKVLIQASVIRASVKTKDEVKLLKIAEEGALSEIKVERDLIKEKIKLNKENTTLSIQDRKNRNAELEAQDILLQAKELQIADQTQLEIEKIRISRLQDTISKVSDLMGQFVTLYENNLNREKEALNIRYNEEVRLADGNKQKLAQLAQDKAKAEYEIELKQFKMRRDLAIADVVMKTAPIIAQQLAGFITAPLALLSYAAQAAQIGIIMSQQPPVPPYKDGTKGRPHPGGPALVGEAGVERVVTTDGKIYYTPPMATLIDLPKGSQVIPNHALSSRELFWANAMNDGKPISPSGGIERKLDKIGGILEALPVHQINMNEKGFEKFVRTPRRTTKILNNQFPLKH